MRESKNNVFKEYLKTEIEKHLDLYDKAVNEKHKNNNLILVEKLREVEQEFNKTFD